jgi:hypothetical protein
LGKGGSHTFPRQSADDRILGAVTYALSTLPPTSSRLLSRCPTLASLLACLSMVKATYVGLWGLPCDKNVYNSCLLKLRVVQVMHTQPAGCRCFLSRGRYTQDLHGTCQVPLLPCFGCWVYCRPGGLCHVDSKPSRRNTIRRGVRRNGPGSCWPARLLLGPLLCRHLVRRLGARWVRAQLCTGLNRLRPMLCPLSAPSSCR